MRVREIDESGRPARSATRGTPHVVGGPEAQRLIALQRAAGNRAVQSLLPGRPAAVQRVDVQRVGLQRVDDGTWPSPAWDTAIRELKAGRKELGPLNGLMKPLLTQKPELAELIAAFVTSLLDPDQNGNQAQAVLREMQLLFRNTRATVDIDVPGQAVPSRFPVRTYKVLKEVINAKRIWLSGDHTMHPWPFDADAEKPDYVVAEQAPASGGTDAAAFYRDTPNVGDHVMVTGARALDDVLAKVASDVSGKAGKYDDKQVRVVVDVSDNTVPELHGPDAGAALREQFRGRLDPVTAQRANLTRVDVIMPSGEVLTVYDRNPAPVPRQEEIVPVEAGPAIDALAADEHTPLLGTGSEARQALAPPRPGLFTRIGTWFGGLWNSLLRKLGLRA